MIRKWDWLACCFYKRICQLSSPLAPRPQINHCLTVSLQRVAIQNTHRQFPNLFSREIRRTSLLVKILFFAAAIVSAHSWRSLQSARNSSFLRTKDPSWIHYFSTLLYLWSHYLIVVRQISKMAIAKKNSTDASRNYLEGKSQRKPELKIGRKYVGMWT